MTSSLPTRPARYAGLDGLRAVAVTMVIVHHLFPGWIFAGGFVGVDVFFVLSGFLITSLLLTEREESGRISLRGFWKRRARRLLPALTLLLTVCATGAWLVGGDVLARIDRQLVGTAVFGYNWVSLAGGGDYFSAGTPELFRNLWSLAVEEQFYVLWPLVLPLLLVVPWRGARVAVALVAAGASALWMADLVGVRGELTRAYFGTDSHAFGLLLGVALAFGLQRLLARPPEWMSRTPWRTAAPSIGAAATAGILWIGMLPSTGTPETFPGALLGASALTVVAIAAGVWPGSWFGRAIDVVPLRWIGDRSYGLYLWHWPLLVLLTAGMAGVSPTAGVPAWIGVVALALTVAAAELSYRLVERPVRRHGFVGSIRLLGRAIAAGPVHRFGALAGIATALLVVGGTTAAIANAPAETSAESVVQAGRDAIDDQPPAPAPMPSPIEVTGAEITAVGDSVMLASAPALVERYPGIQVDASVSRSMYAGPGILEQLAAEGQLRRYVVVALGTNGEIDPATLDRMTQIVGPDRVLILVNAYAPRDWIEGVNADLSAFAQTHERVELADWSSAIASRTELLADDHVHPGSEGARLFTEAVSTAVDTAEAKRTAQQHRLQLHADLLNRGIRPVEPQ